MTEAADIRCPSCRRLLAKRRDDGALEVRQRDRTLAILHRGQLYCHECEMWVGVGEVEPKTLRVLG